MNLLLHVCKLSQPNLCRSDEFLHFGVCEREGDNLPFILYLLCGFDGVKTKQNREQHETADDLPVVVVLFRVWTDTEQSLWNVETLAHSSE